VQWSKKTDGNPVSELIFRAQAPSNIALIKYMGKKDSACNLPSNPSLSLTLNSICSFVEITSVHGGSGQVRWISERPRFFPKELALDQFKSPSLNDSGMTRVIRHFERVKNALSEVFPRFGIDFDSKRVKNSNFFLRTANNFPEASGIASSASSFAALTLAAAYACSSQPERFQKTWDEVIDFRQALAQISRMGSGSSCRSFEGPWVLWKEVEVASLQVQAMPTLAHFVILIRTEPKEVSSSEAHKWAQTSPLWQGRVERVSQRISQMKAALESGNFSAVAEIAWSEAWEMHSLFHTCKEPFTYWEPGTIEGLKWFKTLRKGPHFPIVTLDAGPNIHVLVEKSQQELWRKRLRDQFIDCAILEDEQGEGSKIYELVRV
jgi:diphosphomevalonate decarboxylase